jgi:hypothetical protein
MSPPQTESDNLVSSELRAKASVMSGALLPVDRSLYNPKVNRYNESSSSRE